MYVTVVKYKIKLYWEVCAKSDVNKRINRAEVKGV